MSGALETLVWQGLQNYREELVFQFLRDESSIVVDFAIKRLHIVGGEKTHSLSKKLMNSKNYKDRIIGIRLIGQIKPYSYPYKKSAKKIADKMLDKEKNRKVIAELIIGYSYFGDQSSVLKIIDKIKSKDAVIRCACAFALAKFATDLNAKKALKSPRKDKSNLVARMARM